MNKLNNSSFNKHLKRPTINLLNVNSKRRITNIYLKNIDNYVKLTNNVLGKGTFGTVVLGILKNEEKVAVKILKKNVGEIELFKIKNEINILSIVGSNDRIIKLNSTIEDDNYVYIIQELCEGCDMYKWLTTKYINYGPSELIIKTIVKQLLLIIKYCHNLSIVHGDIKLENMIFKNSDDTCYDFKLIDFGESTIIKNKENIIRNGRCDIYNVGVVMYILFSRNFPSFDNINGTSKIRFNPYPDAFKNASLESLDLMTKIFDTSLSTELSINDIITHPFLN